MMHRVAPAALIIAGLGLAPAAAQPGGGIFSLPNFGGAAYSQGTPAPTSETNAGPPFSHFVPTESVNQLALNWWFYRVSGDTRDRPFGTYTKSDGFTITGTSSWPMNGTGNMSSYSWTENGSSGVRFNAVWANTVTGGTMYQGQVNQSFQITNPNSTPLNISLFNLALWSLSNNADNAVIANGNANAITVTDGVYQETHSAVGASAFQAATDPTLENLLTGGTPYNLNNTGLPYAGDLFTDAFQWNLTVPANSSVTVQSALISAQAVPEPSGLLLVGATGVGALAQRRRKRTRL